MANPFIGEIRMFAGNFAPQGWAFCNGQTLSIAENDALFNLIGTTYGGDGVQTFVLPNLQSRVPAHMGTSASGTYVQGQMAGEENVTLNLNQIPAHTHVAAADSNPGTLASPAGHVWAGSNDNPFAPAASADQQLAAGALSLAGGGQPHDNVVPFLAVNFIIALEGIFPSQN